MLNLYTHDPSLLSLEFWKAKARPLFGKYGGPDAVRDSVKRGLEELAIPYLMNPKKPHPGAALVLSGSGALKKAIDHKHAGVFTKLCAGPNIVVDPSDHDRLLFDPAIDHILVPAPWVADLWQQTALKIAQKLFVWPSGVARYPASDRTGWPIIYDKLGNTDLLRDIKKVIGPARIFSYGRFRRRDYLDALKNAPYLVYLSRSESQGLALQEAWAYDVPTLVNRSTKWQSGPLSWSDPQINCPYLSSETGLIFDSVTELSEMLKTISVLHPKPYCDRELSDVESARRLISLL